MKVTAHQHLLPEGYILQNRYRIEKTLGQGGFGITYRAEHMLLHKKVAIKEFYPSTMANRAVTVSCEVQVSVGQDENYRNWKNKFLKEGEVLVTCQNLPSVVDVLDYFEENNTAYLVMEFLSGNTLRQMVDQNGPMEQKELLTKLLPLLRDLHEMHQRDLLHRDIAPDNIIETPDGKMKLFDFGASRSFSLSEQKSLSLILKPGFAPPEQYRVHGHQGPWTDVYAMCVTIYYCLTGIVPSTAVDRMFVDETLPAAQVNHTISVEISDILKKGMQLLTEERYQSVKEMADAISTALLAAPIPPTPPQPVVDVPVEEPKKKDRKAEVKEAPKEEQYKTEIKEETQKEEHKPNVSEEPKQEEHKSDVSEEPQKEEHKSGISEEPNEENKKATINKKLLIISCCIALVLCAIVLLVTPNKTTNRPASTPTTTVALVATNTATKQPEVTAVPAGIIKQRIADTETASKQPDVTAAPIATDTATKQPDVTAEPTQAQTETRSTYYPNGRINATTYWQDGKRQKAEYYAKDGELRSIGTFVYHEDGTSTETVIFQSLENRSVIREYDADGTCQTEAVYENGEKVTAGVYNWHVTEELPQEWQGQAVYSVTWTPIADDYAPTLDYYTQENAILLGYYWMKNGEPTSLTKVEWQEDGSTIERQYDCPNNRLRGETTKNADGVRIRSIGYDEYGMQSYVTEYESDGSIKNDTGYYEGQISYQFQYEEDGSFTYCEYYDGKLHGEEAYDSTNHFIKGIYYLANEPDQIRYRIYPTDVSWADVYYDYQTGNLDFVATVIAYEFDEKLLSGSTSHGYHNRVKCIYNESGDWSYTDYMLAENDYASFLVGESDGNVFSVYGNLTDDSWIGKPLAECQLTDATEKEKEIFEWMKAQPIPETYDVSVFPSHIDIDNLPEALKISEQTTANAAQEEPKASPASLKEGDVLTFGTYEQDDNHENGKEAIEWVVLKNDGDEGLLLISRYILAQESFNDGFSRTEWEKCTLRTWLNGEFLDRAFTQDEQSQMVGLPSDPVRLLSEEEAEAYDSILLTLNDYTASAAMLRDHYEGKDYDAWWLSTSAAQKSRARVVRIDYDPDYRISNRQVDAGAGVRPVICIRTK